MANSSPWIPVGQLSEAFHPGSYAPTPTPDLAGRTVDLWLEDGRVINCRFETADRLAWSIGPDADQEPSERAKYWAAALGENLYFVDFVWGGERATTVTLLLDLGLRIATVLIGRLPEDREARRPLLERISAGEELTGVSATFLSAAIDQPFTEETPRHLPTDDMVGRRVEYTYSPTERYEHIYLNRSLYTWHCLEGSEKGLGDTDRCHYLKLADELYLFVWREKIVPTLGVVVVDFAALKTAGKILGYLGDGSAALANFAVGAHARLLNTTRHSQENR
jgi:hypothetical protein